MQAASGKPGLTFRPGFKPSLACFWLALHNGVKPSPTVNKPVSQFKGSAALFSERGWMLLEVLKQLKMQRQSTGRRAPPHGARAFSTRSPALPRRRCSRLQSVLLTRFPGTSRIATSDVLCWMSGFSCFRNTRSGENPQRRPVRRAFSLNSGFHVSSIHRRQTSAFGPIVPQMESLLYDQVGPLGSLNTEHAPCGLLFIPYPAVPQPGQAGLCHTPWA